MSFRLVHWIFPGIGLLALALLWSVEPLPEALRERAFSRLLEADLDGEAGLFAALEAVDAPFVLALRVVGAEPTARERRAFDASLAVLNGKRSASGRAPLERRLDAAHRLEVDLAPEAGALAVTVHLDGHRLVSPPPQAFPRRRALAPPLAAIVLALVFRRVLIALFAGIWLGAALLRADTSSLAAIPLGAVDVVWVYFRAEVVDSFRIELIGFVLAILAMIGVMSRGGGLDGLVGVMKRYARTSRSSLGVSFAMGLALFFDDYANCLIVGSSMRPVTDKLGIPREKLAYIVDSTAAPVAGLSLLSTWIAFEVSTYEAQLPAAGITDSAYTIFIASLPYRFYSLFALALVALVIFTRRDLGPMLTAERRAAETGEVIRPGAEPMVADRGAQLERDPRCEPRIRNAILPLGVVIAVAIEEIFRRGGGFALDVDDVSFETITRILFRGGGAGPLFAAAMSGLGVAAFLAGDRRVRLAVAAGVVAALALYGTLLDVLVGGVREDLARLLAVALPLLTSGALVAVLAPRAFGGTMGLDPGAALAAAWASARSVGFAIVILFGAWMIGAVCRDIATADYLVAISAGVVSPIWLPVILFLAACLIAFSTGTSWGTMSILLPNVVGLAAAVGADHTIGAYGMVVVCIGAVLEGSIFGDHCSPISDTTVLSSVASASDHMDHVRTQAPYALLAAAAAVVFGYLPSLALPFWNTPLALASGIAALALVLFVVGRRGR